MIALDFHHTNGAFHYNFISWQFMNTIHDTLNLVYLIKYEQELAVLHIFIQKN